MLAVTRGFVCGQQGEVKTVHCHPASAARSESRHGSLAPEGGSPYPNQGRRTSSFRAWTLASRCGGTAFLIHTSNLPRRGPGWFGRVARFQVRLSVVAQAHECAHGTFNRN